MSTNNTSGVKNICEFATRPLYSADDWSQKNHSFPEHQHQVMDIQSEMLIFNAAKWNMSLYVPPLDSKDQSKIQSADSVVSQMEYLRIYKEQVEKLKALHNR